MLRTRLSLMYQVTMTGLPYSPNCQVVILSKFNSFCFIKKCKQINTKLRCGRHAGKYRYLNSDMQNVIGMYNDNKIAISLCREVFKLRQLQKNVACWSYLLPREQSTVYGAAFQFSSVW